LSRPSPCRGHSRPTRRPAAQPIETNNQQPTRRVGEVTAAESAIRDADIAVEVAALTRSQILVQSTTSILGIANQLPQTALSLLG
jgi:flagellin